MNFNRHSHLEGRHALLSASYYHWLKYDDQKLEARYHSQKAAAEGTALHKLAHDCINLRQRLASSKAPQAKTLAMYVSDAIGYNMTTEQALYYSDNCFGTADTIAFRRNTLRIFDLKTGITPASLRQLEVYAALFCLEYEFSPLDININLRIYQNGDVVQKDPDPDEIRFVMDRIIECDIKIELIKEGNLVF